MQFQSESTIRSSIPLNLHFGVVCVLCIDLNSIVQIKLEHKSVRTGSSICWTLCWFSFCMVFLGSVGNLQARSAVVRASHLHSRMHRVRRRQALRQVQQTIFRFWSVRTRYRRRRARMPRRLHRQWGVVFRVLYRQFHYLPRIEQRQLIRILRSAYREDHLRYRRLSRSFRRTFSAFKRHVKRRSLKIRRGHPLSASTVRSFSKHRRRRQHYRSRRTLWRPHHIHHRRSRLFRRRYRSIRLSRPLRGYRIGSRFGFRKNPIHKRWSFHKGIDIGAPRGTPIRAVASGRIRSAGWRGRCGKGVFIVHRRRPLLVTGYCHMSRVRVRRGQFVRRGQVIGWVGSTGHSTKAHLHFVVQIQGKSVNPEFFIRQ